MIGSEIKRYYLLIGFLLLIPLFGYGQDQKVADNLIEIYQRGVPNKQERMELLKKLAFNESNDLEAALKYSNELIEIATAEKSDRYIYEGHLNKGYAYRLLGDINKALEALYTSSDVAKKATLLEQEAVSYTAIADVYSEIGNAANAELYYDKGIAILRELDKPISLASALFNAGDEYFNNRKFEKALKNYEEAGLIFKNENYLIGSAYTNGNIGMIYAEKGDHRLAWEKINEAIIVLEDLEDYYAISEYLTYMSDIYVSLGDWETAVNYADRSLELAIKNGLKKQIAESNLKLSE